MPDSTYGELELALHRARRGVYEVVLRLVDPQSQAEVAPVRGLAAIDREALAEQATPDAYGRQLAAQVFADAAVRGLYQRARAALERAEVLLRLRIAIEPTAPELHDLRWELLRDPDTDAPLATSERIVLSRFVRSKDWRPIRLRPRARLRAVIAVAAPTNAGDYGLAPFDAAGEVARAREALGELEARVVGLAEPLGLDRLVDALRDGPDIVYLACHSALTRQQGPVLYLQNEAGAAAPVGGAELALRIGELPQAPRLMVLASCESAGTPGAEAGGTGQSALAPLLADAGVPAVLAMQGKITMATARSFMPRFFRELRVDGQIDRAVAVARGAVRAHRDPAGRAGGRRWVVLARESIPSSGRAPSRRGSGCSAATANWPS